MAYLRKTMHNHPFSNKGNEVGVHRLVAEKALGKFIHPRHPVHHVDGDTYDNSGKNLVVCESKKYHELIHMRKNALDACGNPHWMKCKYCGEYDDPSRMYVYPPPNKLAAYHRGCR